MSRGDKLEHLPEAFWYIQLDRFKEDPIVIHPAGDQERAALIINIAQRGLHLFITIIIKARFQNTFGRILANDDCCSMKQPRFTYKGWRITDNNRVAAGKLDKPFERFFLIDSGFVGVYCRHFKSDRLA